MEELLTSFLSIKLCLYERASKAEFRLELAVSLSIFLHLIFVFSAWNVAGGGKSMVTPGTSRLEANLRTSANMKQLGDFVPEQMHDLDSPPAPPMTPPTARLLLTDTQVTTVATQKVLREEYVAKPLQSVSEPIKSDKSGASAGVLNSFDDGPPSNVDVELDLYSGPEGVLLGRARATYKASAGRYSVAVEGDGIRNDMSAVGEKWHLQVMGSIRQAGLYPEAYSGEGTVARQLVGHENTLEKMQFRKRMQDGLFDNQSLFYQFMHLTRQQMSVIHLASADGSYLVFEGRVQEDEVLELEELGSLMTNKYLFRTQGSSESFEVWLLPRQRAVPLRVRHTSADGKILDQRVRTLRTTR